MLQIFYGLGKGKTSTLNGSLLRAKGADFKVAYYRFLKGRKSHENEHLKNIADDFKSFQSLSKFVIQMNPEEKIKTLSDFKVGMNYILMNKKRFDVIIIDEFIDLQDKTVNMFTAKMLSDFLLKLNDKEVMISGHSLPPEIEEIADLITYYKSQKHYFDKGIQARKGFEF